MSRPWIFISPSSRGLGHALARHLLQTTTLPVLATARSDLAGVKASILEGLRLPPQKLCWEQGVVPSSTATQEADLAARLHVLEVDVTDEATVAAAAERASTLFPRETHHLHLGFALPGVLRPERSPAQVEYEAALATLRVNVLGPLMLMKHFGGFLPPPLRQEEDTMTNADDDSGRRCYTYDVSSLPPSSSYPSEEAREAEGGPTGRTRRELPRHATFLAASARVGSISDNRLGGWYSYRASKAGVNSLVKTFDLHLQNQRGGGGNIKKEKRRRGAIAVAYHPGTIRTGLSREFWGSVPKDQLFSPEFAAERLIEVVLTREPEHGGRCWDWKGEEVLP